MSNTSRKLSSDEVSALMEGLQSGEITANSGLNNDVEVQILHLVQIIWNFLVITMH